MSNTIISSCVRYTYQYRNLSNKTYRHREGCEICMRLCTLPTLFTYFRVMCKWPWPLTLLMFCVSREIGTLGRMA